MARNIIKFHYDGPISENHTITLRTLGHTLTHLQSAVDRAAIDLKYGGVAKHARLRRADYLLTDFVVGQPKEGGYILDLINSGPLRIVDRINAALSRAFQEASNETIPFAESLIKQAERRAFAVQQQAQNPVDLSDSPILADENYRNTRYADRAINKEIDQLLSQLRVERYAGSILELQFAGNTTSPVYTFNASLASQFHHVVASRVLGPPVRLDVRLRALDKGNNFSHPVGKAIHAETGKVFVLHFRSPENFNSVVPYIVAGGDSPVVSIVACPVLEYGVFDPVAGDMFFLGLINERA